MASQPLQVPLRNAAAEGMRSELGSAGPNPLGQAGSDWEAVSTVPGLWYLSLKVKSWSRAGIARVPSSPDMVGPQPSVGGFSQA